MRSPIFVRPPTDAERATLHQRLRAADAFTVRRAQIVLASAQSQRPAAIATRLGCSVQTVRNTVDTFNAHGVAALTRRSSGRKTIVCALDPEQAEQLRALLHRSPRDFEHPTSIWTLELAAQTAASEGLTPFQVSPETIRQTLLRLGIRWRRAKHWITSPDPPMQKKLSSGSADRPGPAGSSGWWAI